MRERTADRNQRRTRAIGLAVMTLLMITATIWLTILNGGTVSGLGETIALALAFYAYMAVGLIMLARLPGNHLGRVMTAIGLLTSVGVLAGEYARFGLNTAVQPIPGVLLAAWIAQWWWFPTISLVLVLVPLLFPTGAPPSPRWRWLLWVYGTVIFFTTAGASLAPELAGDDYRVANPIGISAIGDIEEGPAGTVLFLSLSFCMLATLVSLIMRFRRSRGVERQQLKWFVYAGALTVGIPTLEELGLERYVLDSNVLFALVVMLQPVAIGIAVLRYRLYDIDRLISRTLTYAMLTALLLAVYLGGVTLVTAVTAPVTGDSPVAVAAATLAAAALFGPARHRIQSIVDRRFNRARYDAGRTLAAYRTHLRDELELTTITSGLQEAVDTAMQPANTVVWLRVTDA